MTGRCRCPFAQQRMWFLDQLAPGSASYTSGGALRVRGPLTRAARRRPDRGRRPPRDPAHHLHRGRRRTRRGRRRRRPRRPAGHRRTGRRRGTGRRTPPSCPPGSTWRTARCCAATLLRLAPDDHVLVVAVPPHRHRRLVPGAAVGGDRRRLRRHAAARTARAVRRLRRLAAVLAVRRGAGAPDRLLDRPAGRPRPLELPLDKARPAVATGRAGMLPWRLPAEVIRDARAVAAREGATLYMVLLAAFTLVLSRYARTEDIAVGSPMAGRTRAETEALIGFFVNVVAVRTDLSGDPTFRELLGRVRGVRGRCRRAPGRPLRTPGGTAAPRARPVPQPAGAGGVPAAHRRAPAALVAGRPGRSRSPSTTRTPGWTWRSTPSRTGDEVDATVPYAADLFDADTVRQLMHHVPVVLGEVLAAPDRPVSAATMLDATDRHHTLVAWNDTAAPLPEGSVPPALRRAGRPHPDAVAPDLRRRTGHYAELDRRANRFAHLLLAHGVAPTSRSAWPPDGPPAWSRPCWACSRRAPPTCRSTPQPPGRTERIVATSGLRVVVADRPVPGTDGLTVLDGDRPGPRPRHRPRSRPAPRHHGVRHLHLGLQRRAQGRGRHPPQRRRAGRRPPLEQRQPRTGAAAPPAGHRHLHLRAVAVPAGRQADRHRLRRARRTADVRPARPRARRHRDVPARTPVQPARRGVHGVLRRPARGPHRRRGRVRRDRRPGDGRPPAPHRGRRVRAHRGDRVHHPCSRWSPASGWPAPGCRSGRPSTTPACTSSTTPSARRRSAWPANSSSPGPGWPAATWAGPT
ncbi:condensation domain-containing protein [Streptomyces tricolor]|nr:condensation domain-containing protein [Streptomyces tricolor]